MPELEMTFNISPQEKRENALRVVRRTAKSLAGTRVKIRALPKPVYKLDDRNAVRLKGIDYKTAKQIADRLNELSRFGRVSVCPVPKLGLANEI